MTLTIRNATEYPDDEVKQLVYWAMRPFELRDTVVLANHTKGAAYSGMAYSRVPQYMKLLAPRAMRAIRVSVGRPDKFPMEGAYWRNGTEENHCGEWPLFKHETWQEALVAISAHEAKHVEDYMHHKNKRTRELDCELIAAKILKDYLAGEFKTNGRKEYTVSEETENGLAESLRTAVSAIEGVTLEDKKNYYIVKHGKRTLGYVGGSRKISVTLPTREGQTGKLAVADEKAIPKVIVEMSSFIPPLEQEAKPDPK